MDKKSTCGYATCDTTTPNTWSLTDSEDWGDNWNDNAEQNGNNCLQDNSNFPLSNTCGTSFEEDELNVDMSNLQVDDPNANR